MTTTFEEELARSGRLVYRNVGRSMLPLLRENRDLIVIEPIDFQALCRFDVVLFRRFDVQSRGTYVLHRILRRCRDGRYWIVGDNCAEGEYVVPEQILGKMTALQRGKKTIQVSDPAYRLFVLLWCVPWPLRFIMLRFLRRCCRTVYRLYRITRG